MSLSNKNLKSFKITDLENIYNIPQIANEYTQQPYNIGDYVNYQGVIYRCTTQISVSEAWNSSHWTSVMLADDLRDNYNDLKSALLEYVNSVELWEQGSISGETGNNTSSTTRLRTIDTLPTTVTNIVVSDGYKFFVSAYSENDEYVGSWNGTTFVTTGALWISDRFVINQDHNYHYRIVLAKNNNSTITTSDFNSIDILSSKPFEIDVDLESNMHEVGLIWKQGTINSHSELVANSNRISTNYLDLEEFVSISVDDAVSIMYVLFSNDETIIYSSGWIKGNQILRFTNGSKIRFVLKYDNNDDITPDDAANLASISMTTITGCYPIVEAFVNNKIKKFIFKKLKLDDTLKLSKCAADSKTVGKHLVYKSQEMTLWKNGSIVAANGNYIVSNNKIYTMDYVSDLYTGFVVNDGYFAWLFAYLNNGSYVGFYNGSTFAKTGNISYLQNFSFDKSLSYNYIIVLGRTDGTNAIVSDASNITFVNDDSVYRLIEELSNRNDYPHYKLKVTSSGRVDTNINGDDSSGYLSLCAVKERFVDGKPSVAEGYLFTQSIQGPSKLFYSENLDTKPVQIGVLNNVYTSYGQVRVYAISPTYGDIITLKNDDHVTPFVYDVSESTVSTISNLEVIPCGWLSTGSFDFGIDNDNNEFLMFGEYNGHPRGSSEVDDNWYIRIWKVTYPYTESSNWRIVYQAKRSSSYMNPQDDGIPYHFHTCQRDPYTDIWYATSGDADSEIIWLYSTNYGETWTQFHNGTVWSSQVARVINFVFTEDYVYWGNDSATNHCLSRLSRSQSGLMDINSYTKLCDLGIQSTYATCYLEYPHGLFMYDRRDITGIAPSNPAPLKLQFYSIDDEKLYDLKNYTKLGSSELYGFGLRNRFAIIRQSPYTTKIGCGFDKSIRNNIDMEGNDENRLWTLLFEIY